MNKRCNFCKQETALKEIELNQDHKFYLCEKCLEKYMKLYKHPAYKEKKMFGINTELFKFLCFLGFVFLYIYIFIL
jgi:transposase-like protein